MGRWGKELHGPSGENKVFPVHVGATLGQIIEDRLGADDESARLRTEGDEDVHVQRGNRLQVEGGADGSTDRIALDDAVMLHLVDGREDFLDLHVDKTCKFRSAIDIPGPFKRG